MKEQHTGRRRLFVAARLVLLLVIIGLLLFQFIQEYAGTVSADRTETNISTEAVTEPDSQGPEYAATPEYIETNVDAEFDSLEQAVESQLPGSVFSDMSAGRVKEYVGDLGQNYEFRGRTSPTGGEYLVGIAYDQENPLEGLTFRIESQDEGELTDCVFVPETESETGMEAETGTSESYRLKGISECYVSGDGRTVVLVTCDSARPLDAVMSCEPWTSQGQTYLADRAAAGVSVMPPSAGGFVCVRQIRRGREEILYIALTAEELKQMDQMASRTTIDGLSYYKNLEEYEKNPRVTGQIPLSVLEMAKEKCGFQVVDAAEVYGVTNAYLCTYGADGSYLEETVTDAEQLETLEKLLAGSEKTAMSSCPYSGVLELTRDDGTKITVQLATDGCDGFVLGSYVCYTPGEEGTARLWEIFPQTKAWLEENAQPSAEQTGETVTESGGRTDG